MITKIEAVNYRCLRNVSQALGGFHVLTGPNGSGKSTFLEVPYLLSRFAREGLDAVWDAIRARNFDELTYQRQGGVIQLAVETKVPDSIGAKPVANGSSGGKTYEYLRYEVEIGKDSTMPSGEPRILAENLWLIPAPSVTPRNELVQLDLDFPSESKPDYRLIHAKTLPGWRKIASKTANQNAYFRSETTEWNLQIRNPATKSALSTLPEDEERFRLSNWFKAELVDHLQKIMLRSELMQAPSAPLKRAQFAVDGSNLPQVIQALQRDGPSYQGWLAHVQTILPIREVKVLERPEDRQLYLEVTYKSGTPVNSWHLSDGSLRLLALTVLAYLPEDGSVYLIEEPENGVHPQAIEAVYQSLSQVMGGQVLVATHSPVFVAQVKPEQLLCFSKYGDATDVIRGDQHPKLRNWRGDLNLSQLYAAGILS